MGTTINSKNIYKRTRLQRLLDRLLPYTVVYLNISEANENHTDAIEILRNKFSHFETFDNYNLFEGYIENRNSTEQIIVIVTSRQHIPKLYDKSRIIAIYVYYNVETEQKSTDQYTQCYPKVCNCLL